MLQITIMRQDLHLAVRRLTREPGVALFTIVTCAVTLAAATAIFAIVDTVVMRDLPFRDPGRLVWMWNARVERDRAPFSILDLEDYAANSRVLEGVAPFTNWTANLIGVGETERLEGLRVATNFFAVLGAEAAVGRTFQPSTDPNERAVVITDRLWRRRFGGDPGAIGRKIDLSGVPYTIAGVMPPRFAFPFRDADIASPMPIATHPRRPQRGFGFLRVVARLRPGVDIDAAKRELDAIGARLRTQFPDDDGKKTGVNLFPLQAEIVGDSRQLLLTLLGAVVLLLLLACANIANVMLVSATSRRAEVATRLALGASRGRIARQLLTESIVLVAIGGGVGVVGAMWLAPALATMIPGLPGLDGVAMNARVALFVCAALAVCAVVCGAFPAAHASGELQRSAPPALTVRRVLVAAQLAVSLMLMVTVGLTIRGFVNLQRVDPGFSPAGVLSVQLSLPPARYSTVPSLVGFVDRLRPRLEAIGGVRRVAEVSLLPLSGLLRTEDLWIVGRPDPAPDAIPQAHLRFVTPGYFDAMGITRASGRDFSDDDRENTTLVAVISRSFADRFWPDGNPVGQHFRLALGPAPIEVIGVVSDVKQFSLDAPSTADAYLALRQMPASEAALSARMYWVLRTDRDPAAFVDRVRAEIRGIDPDVASSSARTMEEILDGARRSRRFNMVVLLLFGAAALVLAAIGVYAVTSAAVGRRTREIGIRVAFGAAPADIAALVAASELRAAAAGLVVGIPCAAAIARAIAQTLFRVDPFDFVTMLSAVTVLGLAAGLACAIPLARAVRLDPAAALRERS